MIRDRLPALLLILLALASPAAAQAPIVQPEDRLSIRVISWDPIEGVLQDWPAIAGEYGVTAGGALSVPFVGQLEAAGRPPEEIAAMIAEGLRNRFALNAAPEAVVAILQSRPVVVGGAVRAPGQLPFTQGMTVRSAIAQAGGLVLPTDQADFAGRDYVNSEGQLLILRNQRRRQLARLERLLAEREERELVMPAELDDIEGRQLLAEEEEIMEHQTDRLEAERVSLSGRQELLTAQIASLEQRTTSLERQLELAREALENAQALSERNLVSSDRLADAERNVLTIEGQILENSNAILSARLDLSANDRELSTLTADYRTGLINELQQVRANLADTEQRIATTTRLIGVDAERAAAAAAEAEAGGALAPEPELTIYRTDAGAVTAMEAGMETTLRPGDLVDVESLAAAPLAQETAPGLEDQAAAE
ncbi:polysaccharide biosynthesis/export family protein [Pseudoroseicyclus tamaricis]|uniref:Uncharacterized protein n=1 Tax=Pseudoroseicyclus tamaricis TaxID=2705421 RepID=A0A6B2JTP5_9RHOB|nr:polysaccharide biosynthesis/export family protein [Pseudoroseicyclus tamaricis]NDV01335.1 hypothetical protein [Pseudoroseicyclus tamaricis]